VTPGNVKVKQTTWDIGVTWFPNLVHHFFRRIPEARWLETVRARSDISTLAMTLSLVFELSRQKTSFKSHEQEKTNFVRFATGSVLAMFALYISSKFCWLKAATTRSPERIGRC
jgi:hypothetical protein